jgi:hypothetical protein
MVLGEHGVCRIGAPVVVEHNVLLIFAAFDNLHRSRRQLVLDLIDDRDNERGNDREHKDGQLLLELLNELW